MIAVSKRYRARTEGIILTGGPASTRKMLLPRPGISIGVPVLGIGYGMQLMAFMLGGEIEGKSCLRILVQPAQILELELFSVVCLMIYRSGLTMAI